MQLYHHSLSMDSQKVRLALEENAIDYTSYHINPLTGKNMDPSFFRLNPSAKLPVFKNGSHVIYDTLEIIEYIQRIAAVSSRVEEDSETTGLAKASSSRQVSEWMHKVQEWNPKFFTLSHVPDKHRLQFSKFLRRVIIARMAETPDLAAAYHLRLKDAYDTEDMLKDTNVSQRSKEQLVRLLDEVEEQLGKTTSRYLVGEELTMADVMLIPVLTHLSLLQLEDEYINSCRPNVARYWAMVQQRPSYKKVIGKYVHGWGKQKTLVKTWLYIRIRSLLRRY